MLALSLLVAAMATMQNSYHGYPRSEFSVNGLQAVLVAPHSPAPNRPWIWRTEFFDHRPELDLALLAKGFHLAYLDLQNGYGSPGALEQYSHFYRQMVNEHGLHRKVVLEGFSRGGLSAYNWASANPDKVMAIYADAPVCDFRSWPYRRPEAAEDWKRLVKEYGFPSEEDALSYQFGPLGKLEPLSKARVPLIHVVGQADEVVPVSANTDILEREYRRLGGLIKVIRKEGVGHHPHSLADPTPILEFILKHQEKSSKAPFATVIPAPNPETRNRSAGWQSSWLQQHEDSRKAAAELKPELVLLGDSITQGWGGPGRFVYQISRDAYQRHLAPFRTVNMGISGERTQHLLWRLDHGALDQCQAKTVGVLIGVNNLGSDSPSAIIKGVAEVITRIKRKMPRAKIILHALFPVGRLPSDPRRALVSEVNRGLKNLSAKRRLEWLDLTPDLLNADGSTWEGRMAGDSLHLGPEGYEIWGQRLEEAAKESKRVRV